MNEKNMKKSDDLNSSAISVKNNNEKSYVIPNEAACSPEFSEGCCIMDDKTQMSRGQIK